MATVTISNAFMNTDLSGIKVGAALNDAFFTLYEETLSWFNSEEDGPPFSGEPFTEVYRGGYKFKYTNPIIDGNYATYETTGYFSGILDSNLDVTSLALDLNYLTARTKLSYEHGDGDIILNGTIKGSSKNNVDKVSYNVTKASFVGNDGTKWSIGGSLKYSYTEKFNASDSDITENFTGSINTISSSDANGNALTLTGKYTYNTTADTFTGNMTTLKLTVGSTQLTATKLKITLDDWEEAELSSVANILDFFLVGNDVITLGESGYIGNYEYPKAVYGYAGNDKITGSNYADWLVGGEYSEYFDHQPYGDEEYVANSGNDKLYGRAGDDILAGLDGNDTLDGGEGDDVLFGGSGDDKLIGGAGDDLLDAYGGGKDILTGGTGSDIFSFTDTSLSNAKISTITDFKTSEGDKIEFYSSTLNQYIFLTDDEFYKAPGAAGVVSEGQIFAYDTKSGRLYFDVDSVGGNPAVVVAILTGKPNLTADDFY